jgi:hypothetical protein
MPYRNSKTNVYSEGYPHRIRLDNGYTLTGPEVNDSLLETTGWVWEDYPPPLPAPVIDVSTLTNTIV